MLEEMCVYLFLFSPLCSDKFFIQQFKYKESI